jgi:hypothetical protein
MLRGTSLALLDQYDTVTVVAQHARTLASLKGDAGPRGARLQTLQIDYRNTIAFRHALMAAREAFGDFVLAVGWIRSAAVEARDTVAEVLNEGRSTARFFDIVGSASGDPVLMGKERAGRFAGLPRVAYRTIILGFVLTPGGSRWLTDEEISGGVLRAVENDEVCAVVGAVEPWTARP